MQNEIRHHYLKAFSENCIDSVNEDCIWNWLENKDKLLQNDQNARNIEKDIRGKIENCFANSFEKKSDD